MRRTFRLRLPPRWHKLFSDLWGSRVRSMLVIASLFVGLFAVGMIVTLRSELAWNMRSGYAALDPATIVIQTGGIDEEDIDVAGSVDGVQSAEGRRSFDLMTRSEGGQWNRLRIETADFGDSVVSRPIHETGSWPPQDQQIVIERNKRAELDTITGPDGRVWMDVRLPSGKIRKVEIIGTVHDQTLGVGSPGGFFLHPIQGYMDESARAWLEQPENASRILITVSQGANDEAHLREIANRVSAALEDSGVLVYNAQVNRAIDHPNAAYVDAMTGILFVLGALIVALSTFLITNTLAALLKQQSQQIAIMKTFGARSHQIAGLYMLLIALYGLIALALAIPLSRLAAYELLDFLTWKINFRISAFRPVPLATTLQTVIALIVPQIAGIAPILRGARQKVQVALSDTVSEEDPLHRGWLDRKIAEVRGLSRPLLISLRNTFRHKGRLALTLTTLALGGAIFIATFNVRAGLDDFIARVSNYFRADVNVTLDGPYRIREIEQVLGGITGVDRVEAWAFGASELLLENGDAGDSVQLLGPPAGTALVQPILLRGRWIEPGDRNAVALSERFLSRYPDLAVGNTLELRVNGETTDWQVVGFFQLVGKSAGYIAYTDYDSLSRVVGEKNRAVLYRVTAADPHLTQAQQRALGAQIEQALQDSGIGVSEVSAGLSLVTNTARPLNTLTTFLLIMAGLTALVGAIGLTGTMGMNVLDRTREIGVMRAIGASNRAIRRLVLGEGILIGLISWGLAVVAALPISKILSDQIQIAVFDTTATFTFTAVGPLAWFGLVLLLSALSSWLPAQNAARLTIREALEYE